MNKKVRRLMQSTAIAVILLPYMAIPKVNAYSVTQADPAPTLTASATPIPSPNGVIAPKGETVLFDNTHGETAGQADWVIDGAFSDFANSIANLGYNVKEFRSTNAYTANPTITPAVLQGVNILVLAESQIPFKQSEQTAISSFVANGGAVLYIGDHYDSDRNKNTIDSTEAFNGYRRGADTQAAAQITASAEGNSQNYYPNLDPMTAGMSSEAANSGAMQGVVTSDWLSDTFGVRFRYNAIDNLANDGQVPVSQANDAFNITQGVNDVALHAGATIEITNPNTAYGLVYLPTLTSANKSTYAVDDGVYGDAAVGNSNSGGGGTNEGAYVAIAKHGSGKAAFIGDTSMVEDATPKYANEESGGLKSTFDGFKEQNDSVLLENLINWLGTEQSNYNQFNQSGVSDSTLPNRTLASSTPLITSDTITKLQAAGDTSKYLQYENEVPAESKEVPGTEPWAAPTSGYLWYSPSTFKNGSFGSVVDPTVQPGYEIDYPTTNINNNGKSAIVAGADNVITIKFTGLMPNTTTSAGYNVGIYGLNGNASQIAISTVPGQTTTQTTPGYSSKFEVTADANGNATAVVHVKVPANDVGAANFRLRTGSTAVKTDSIDLIASDSGTTPTPTNPVVNVKNTTLNIGASWTAADNFISVVDSEGNTITDISKITVSGTVDTTKAGTYTVAYSYNDATSGLTGSSNVEITVSDSSSNTFNAVPSSSPSFILSSSITAGQETKTTISFTGLTPGVTYTGLNFGLYTSTAFGSFANGNQIATTRIGDNGAMSTTTGYSAQFSVTADNAGNASQVVYFIADASAPTGTYNLRLRQTQTSPTGSSNSTNLVTVKPTLSAASPTPEPIAPIINVKNTTINQGTTWTAADNFVSATDSEGKAVDISQLTVTGSVDTSAAGTYSVIYSYTDPITNLSDQKNAVVTVKAAPTNPTPPQPDYTNQPVYRLYNQNSGQHLFTTSRYEKDSDVKAGWLSEDIAFNAQKAGIAVYRVYNRNSGEHLYTTSSYEKNSLVKQGWSAEGIAFYASKNGSPVYRIYNQNTGEHFYTTSAYEVKVDVKAGWKSEGIAFYTSNLK